MNKFRFFSTLLTVVLGITIFTSCDSNSVEIKDVINSSNKIATVTSVVNDAKRETYSIIRETAYKKDGMDFTLSLKDLPDSYLVPVEEIFQDYTISDTSARMSPFFSIAFYAKDRNNNFIGYFNFQEKSENELVVADWIYVDRDVNITNNEEDSTKYDLHLKKGTNSVYIRFNSEDKIEAITHKKPSGAKIKWHFTSYNDEEGENSTSQKKDNDYFLWNKSTGKIMQLVVLLYMLCFFIKAIRCGRLLPWIVITVAAVYSVQDPYYLFLPALPALFVSYYMLFGDSSDDSLSRFSKWLVCGFFGLSIYTFYKEGFTGIINVIIWLVTSLVAWYMYSVHTDKSVCKRCGKYASHTYLTEELISRDITRKRVHKDSYRDTTVEDRLGKKVVVDWYRRRYGQEIDIWECYDVYHECVECRQIFKSSKDKHENKTSW